MFPETVSLPFPLKLILTFGFMLKKNKILIY